MSSMSPEQLQLFESLTQPLRAAQIEDVGMTMRDVQLLEQSQKIPSKVEVILPLKKEGQNIQIQEKMAELRNVEINHLAFTKKVVEVLSDPDFQAIFSQNKTEEKIILELAYQLQIYLEFHEKSIKKPLAEAGKDLPQIGVLYSEEVLSLQRPLILAFPRLFSLEQIFTNERNREKIKRLIEKKFKIIKMTDPHRIVEQGQLSTIFMQTVIRRKMLLEEFYIAIAENDPNHSEITRVYTSLAEQSWETNNVMDGTNVIKRDVNQDPFCLRKVLCDNECFKELRRIAARDPEKVEALDFLRELSILIQENDFLENTEAADSFTRSELGSEVQEERKFKQLAEGPVPRNFEIIYHILIEFVNSPFFIEKAKLSIYPDETEETYQKRLDRLALRGELIKLYRQESRKEEGREERVKEKEESKEESKGESAAGKGTFEVVVGTVSQLPGVKDELDAASSSKVVIKGNEKEIREPIMEEEREENDKESIKENQEEHKEEGKKENAVEGEHQSEEENTEREHEGAKEEQENIEEMEIVVDSDEDTDDLGLGSLVPSADGSLVPSVGELSAPSADGSLVPSAVEPLVRPNLAIQYVGEMAKMLGNFVCEDPATAVTFALVSCMAVGIGIATAGGGIVLAAAVAGAVLIGVSAVGTWCAFYSGNTSKPERSQKSYNPTEDPVLGCWMPYRL